MTPATADGHRFYADLESLELEMLASVSDIQYFHGSSADTYCDTVAKTPAIRGLTLLEVDMHAVGEFPPWFPFNQILSKPSA